MKETAVVRDVLDAVKPLEGGHFSRNNTGLAWLPGRGGKLQPARFGEEGAADILGCWLGRVVGIECKTSTGRQRPAQGRWQEKIEKAGGLYILARSAADALAGLGVLPGHPRRPSGRIIHR